MTTTPTQLEKQQQAAADLANDIKTLLVDDTTGFAEFTQKVDSLKPQLVALSPRVEAEVLVNEENFNKRKLYAEVELLRLELNQDPVAERLETVRSRIKNIKRNAFPAVHEQFESTAMYQKAEEVYSIMNDYRRKLSVVPVRTSLFKKTLNFAVFIYYLWCCINVSILVTLILRPLEPLFLKAGWPTNQLPSDYVQRWFCRSCLFWAGVEPYWEHLNRIDESKSYVVMYSHQSSYDAWSICTSPLSIRLMGKPELFYIPFFGWLGSLWRHIPISRTNLDAAKKSIALAVQGLKDTGRSTAISPEGTRSPTGRLIDFKKGAFHMALQAQLPILPLLLLTPAEIWPSTDILNAPGRITLRVLEPITILPGETYQQLRYRVHKQFLEEFEKPISHNVKSLTNDCLAFFSLPVCTIVTYYEFKLAFCLVAKLFGY